MMPILAALLLALGPVTGIGRGSDRLPRPRHDLHRTTTNAAVEGESVMLRIRFFKDDLEVALGAYVGASVLALDTSPEADRVFLDYLREHLHLEVEDARLAPVILARGEDLADREPMWWYALEYRATAPVRRLTMRNTLLFERFEDQRNVVRFVHFPGEAQQTFTFTPGEGEHVVEFGGGRGR
ncbi:MAG: hypothetical protein RQ751_03360 [Longimicrobiales bacterium]|nr:hypothetical protein [Longimicrobiales bacterium]